MRQRKYNIFSQRYLIFFYKDGNKMEGEVGELFKRQQRQCDRPFQGMLGIWMI